MFAYCNNNPVACADPRGNIPNVNLMATDAGYYNWDTFFYERAINQFVDKKMFSDLTEKSKYPFCYGSFISVKVEQIDDFESTYGNAVLRTIGSYSASYVGGEIAKKVIQKIAAKGGIAASSKFINIGIAIGTLGYDVIKTLINYDELPKGTYNQYIVTVEGQYSGNIVGYNSCTYHYQHILTVAERTIGKETSYVILAEEYYTWR